MSQPAYDVEPLGSYDDQDTNNESAEVQAARARVEQTRSEMEETIDAIKDKLEPRHLVDQAKESMKEATIGKAQHAMGGVMDKAKDKMGDVMDRAKDTAGTVTHTAQDYTTSIGHTIRENPIPFALIGIGIGWLIMSSRSNGRHGQYSTSGRESWHRDDQNTHRYEDPAWAGVGAAPGYRGADHGDSGIREVASRAQEKAGAMAERMKDRTSEMADRVKHRTSEMASRVQEGAQQAKERARYRTRQTVGAVQGTLEENPLAVGAVALAIGAAVGLLLPETQKERELMGEARDRMMSRAQETAQELGQKVQHVAREVVDTAKQEAKNEGLMPGSNQDQQQRAA